MVELIGAPSTVPVTWAPFTRVNPDQNATVGTPPWRPPKRWNALLPIIQKAIEPP